MNCETTGATAIRRNNVRFILTGAVLCALLFDFSLPALAGEHYVEVWNPPEARHRLHKPAAGARKGARQKRAQNGGHTTARKIADPAAAGSGSAAGNGTGAGAGVGRTKRPLDLDHDIPRKIGPDGNVMQV